MNQITEFAKVTSHNNSASWPMEKKGFDFFLYLTSLDPLPLNPEDRELPKRAGSVQEIRSCNHFQNPDRQTEKTPNPQPSLAPSSAGLIRTELCCRK